MDKLTIRDVDVTGKRVFLRVDFNVPLEDGKITDDSRIRAAVPTIKYLLSHGAKVILASHLGRPNGKVHDGLLLRPTAERLTQLIGRNVSVTGDSSRLDSWAISCSIRNPAYAGRSVAIPTVDAWARWAVPNASLT